MSEECLKVSNGGVAGKGTVNVARKVTSANKFSREKIYLNLNLMLMSKFIFKANLIGYGRDIKLPVLPRCPISAEGERKQQLFFFLSRSPPSPHLPIRPPRSRVIRTGNR